MLSCLKRHYIRFFGVDIVNFYKYIRNVGLFQNIFERQMWLNMSSTCNLVLVEWSHKRVTANNNS